MNRLPSWEQVLLPPPPGPDAGLRLDIELPEDDGNPFAWHGDDLTNPTLLRRLWQHLTRRRPP